MTTIPEKSVEAARAKLMERNRIGVTYEAMEAVLEAAAPFMQRAVHILPNDWDSGEGIEAAAQELEKIGALSHGRDLLTTIRALKRETKA